MTFTLRAEVIQTFRDRIRNGSHVRLSTDDFAVLIEGFVEGLRGAKSKRPIQAMCEAEIKLLEEGYPQASVAKYLSQYRKAIKTAIEDGSLRMTRATSHRYVHTQRVTGIKEERLEHWALTYLKYSNEVYEMLDKRQQGVQRDEMAATNTSEVDDVPIPVALELPLEAATVPKARAVETEISRDEDDMAITEEVQQLKHDWKAEMDEKIGRFRAEFLAQLEGAKQDRSVSWFVKRIESLEEENLKLRLEQDHAIATGVSLGRDDSSEVDGLKAENVALSLELATVRDKLNAFRRLLNGDADQGEGIAGDAEDGGAITAHPQSEQVSTVSPQPTDAGDNTRRAETTRGTTAAAGTARGPKAGKAFERAENIFLAVKDWNRLNPLESFAFNAGILETVFKVHRQAVKDFFDAYQNELWEYHQEIGVESPKWHNRGKDTVRLKAFVDDWVSKTGADSGENAIN
jgi:Telomere resolvase